MLGSVPFYPHLLSLTSFQVPALLFAEDVVAGDCDDQSVMLYLSLLRAAYDEQKELKVPFFSSLSLNYFSEY